MRKSTNGFTIVELLIVIVVIAILAAISITVFSGVQDRARISSAQSFASQIEKRDSTDAQGFWKFDECSGLTSKNFGGQASNAQLTLVGSPTWSTDTLNGSGCSISLNGASSLNTDISLTNSYYLKSAWIKTTSASTSMSIISDSTGSSTNSALYLNAAKLSSGHNGSYGAVSGGTALNDGKWHHVAVEFIQNSGGTTGTMKLYVDGINVSTNTSVNNTTDASKTMSIGGFGTGSRFVGLIDSPLIITK